MVNWRRLGSWDAMDDLADHVEAVLRSLISAQVTPVLGAGANLCGRPAGFQWSLGTGFFPSGAELAAHLAARFRMKGVPSDLMEVASWIQLTTGEAELSEALREIFDRDGLVSPVHAFIARFIAEARRAKRRNPIPLIVTTNYDDVLERALWDERQDFDVVSYLAHGESRGLFVHIAPAGAQPVIIKRARAYLGLVPEERPTILKLHGTVDRRDPTLDNFVLTEEHYVDYLTTDVWDAIPVQLAAEIRQSHLLFMGYAMRDWNLLVVLRRLGLLPSYFSSWAVQLSPDDLDIQRWNRWRVDIVAVGLDAYIAELWRQYQLLDRGNSNAS